MLPLNRSRNRSRFFGLAVPQSALDLDFLSGTLDPRITFTRASSATQFDSSGTLVYAPHNLLLWSENFGDAVWTNNRITVNTDATTAPSGTLTADKLVATAVLGDHGISASNTTIAPGSSVTSSVFVRKAEYRYAYLWLDNGSGTGQTLELDFDTGTTRFTRIGGVNYSNISGGVVVVGNGWFRLFITATTGWTVAQLRVYMSPTAWVSGNFGTPQFTGDGTSGIFVWGAQLNQTPVFGGVTASLSTYYPTTSAAYYGPRFDYDPVTLAARGLLIEEQRTNLLTWSENFGDAAWGKANGAITTNVATAPDGANTADKWVPANGAVSDGNDDVACVQQGATITSGQSYVQTFYAKAAEFTSLRVRESVSTGARANVNLLTGVVVYEFGNSTQMAVTAESVGAGWWRITCQRTASSTSWRVVIKAGATGDGTSGILLWGAQLEAGAFATSYIPTTSATATRAADLASINTLTPWYNAIEGTFYSESAFVAPLTTNYFCRAFEISDTTSTERMTVLASSSLNRMRFAVVDGSLQSDLSDAAIPLVANSTYRTAASYKQDDFGFSVNGNTASTDTAGTVPTVTKLYLGVRFDGTSDFINGWLRRLVYWPARLPNSQLQFITA